MLGGDEVEGLMSEQVAQAMISCNNKENQESESQQLSFLDEGPILFSKLPRQIFDLFRIASPNVISVLGISYYNLINMYFAKLLDNTKIVAAYGLGSTWHTTTTHCIQISICNGLFIQLAHSFGAKQYKEMQGLFQRCQGILFTFGILSSFILLSTKDILMWFGINEQISILTQDYAISCIPSIFGAAMYDSLKQLLLAQNIFDVPMKIGLIVYLIHPIWLYLFTIMYEFGIAGIGFARGLSEWSGFLALYFYINKKNLIEEVWDFKYDFKIIFSKWINFLKIAVPIGALVMLEWMFLEIQTFIVAKLNDEYILAGQAAFQSLLMFFFMAPLGLSWTTNSYLGNAVGQGRKKLCQQFSKIIMISNGALVIIFIILGEIFKGFFYDIFTVDDEMGKYFTYAYNFYLFGFLISDFYQVTLNGILKCCDKQNFAAICYFLDYYVLGIPMTIFLTFTLDLKQTGVWITQSIVAGLVCIIFYITIIKIDWDQAIRTVQLRVKKEHEIIDQQLYELDNI